MKQNRRKLTIADRLTVYKKTNGHCAYCGCSLSMREMAVDHIQSPKDDLLQSRSNREEEEKMADYIAKKEWENEQNKN